VPDIAKRRPRRVRSVAEVLHVMSIPLLALVTLDRRTLHPAYGMTLWRRLRLVIRLYRNTRVIETGISYKAHVAMAAKLLSTPPDVGGVVVECGSWKGGTTANLSLICRAAHRQLVVYDSFQGLPPAEPGDRHAKPEAQGMFCGDLDTVRRNVERYGDISRCEFRKGWFVDTLPHHTEPIVLTYLDVDFQSSLHDCVVHLWPHLAPRGHLFIDEYVLLDYCGLFWSESFWERHFGTRPPGLMGSGTGVGLGQYYLGPFDWTVDPTSVAYTRKDFSGWWGYERDPS
jgi:O-methyltransferase